MTELLVLRDELKSADKCLFFILGVMNTVDIITLIAVILFARLGVRLYLRYRKMKKENGDNPRTDD